MKENRNQPNETMELDVKRVFHVIWSKKFLIAIVAVVCAAASLLGTWLLITPEYESKAMFYVNNYAQMVESNGSITSSDITASKNLVESYITILNTYASLDEVIAEAGVRRSASQLEKMISASSVNSTEIFQVVVTSTDPEEALKIAQAITVVLPRRISTILEGTSAHVVDNPRLPTEPSSPSYSLNTVLGFLAGLLITLAAIVLNDVFDVTVRSEEDITRKYNLPILSSVPDMEAPSKDGYYSYQSAGKTTSAKKSKNHVGSEISFAATEAYKLLRTKIQFSFADENSCHVIGVSSAMAGEGKSTTAVNLAYSFAQLGSRVLLIDCDLRRPSVPDKIAVAPKPGLTDFLALQTYLPDVLQKCQLDEVSFNVIASGHIPPNPIELLSSQRMAKAITVLRKSFDYIILDLPPVSEVSDALAAAKLTDGMLLVVRQNYCNRLRLEDAVRQFEFMDQRVLGVVVACAVDETTGYKKYYKKYGGYYGYAPKKNEKPKAKTGK